MKYKEALTQSMLELSKDEKVVFIGQGVIQKDAIYDTLKVPISKVIEMPVAENLIMGVAIGMALKGYKPVIIFQRMDFMIIAADAIINHLSVYHKLGLSCQVLIRAIVGSQSTKFYCGLQHTKDLTNVFKDYITTVVLDRTSNIKYEYSQPGPRLIVEHKDLYEEEAVYE